MPPRAIPGVADHEDSDIKEETNERRRNRHLASMMLDQEKNRRVTEAAREALLEMRERKAHEQYADALMEMERMRRIEENAVETNRGEREVEEGRKAAITQVDAWADLEQLRRAAEGLDSAKEEREGRMSSIQYAIQQELKEQDERIASFAAGLHDSRVAEKQSKLDNVRVATEAAEQERQRRMEEQQALQRLQEWERLNNQKQADQVADIERTRRMQEDPQERDFQWKRSRMAALALEAASSPRHSFMGRLHHASEQPHDLQEGLPSDTLLHNPLLGPPFVDMGSDSLLTVQQQVLGYIGNNNLPPITSPFENSPYAMFTKSIMDTFAQAQSHSQSQQSNLFNTGVKKSPMRARAHENLDHPPSPLPFPQGVPANIFLDPVLFPNPLFNLTNGSEALMYPPYLDPQHDPMNMHLNQPYSNFHNFPSSPYPSTQANEQDFDNEYESCLRSSRKVRKMTRERQKRVKMNHKFEQLCQMLELGTNNRIEKITILSEAIRSVKHLLRENQFLKGQTVALVARLQQVRNEKGNGHIPSFLQVSRSTSASSDFGKLSLADSSRQASRSPHSQPAQQKETKPTRHAPRLQVELEDEEEAGTDSEEDGAESEVPLVMHDSPLHRFRILDEDPMHDLIISRAANGDHRHSEPFLHSVDTETDTYPDIAAASSSSIFSSTSPLQHTSTTVESVEELNSVFRNSLFGQDEVHSRSSNAAEIDGRHSTKRNGFVPNISISVNSANHHAVHPTNATSESFSTPNPLTTPTDSAFEHSKDLFNFISDNDPVHIIFPTSPTKEPLSPINSPTSHPQLPPDPLGPG